MIPLSVSTNPTTIHSVGVLFYFFRVIAFFGSRIASLRIVPQAIPAWILNLSRINATTTVQFPFQTHFFFFSHSIDLAVTAAKKTSKCHCRTNSILQAPAPSYNTTQKRALVSRSNTNKAFHRHSLCVSLSRGHLFRTKPNQPSYIASLLSFYPPCSLFFFSHL